MARLLSPDDNCVSADVPQGKVPLRYDGRIVTATDPAHVAGLRAAGYTSADAGHGPARTRGWRCPDCEFGSYFRRCSRCGGQCQRD